MKREQIIKILNESIGLYQGKDITEIADEIIALPIDVPSEEELEPYFTYKKPYIEDEQENSKTYFAFSADELYAVKLFWRWMKQQIIERNK